MSLHEGQDDGIVFATDVGQILLHGLRDTCTLQEALSLLLWPARTAFGKLPLQCSRAPSPHSKAIDTDFPQPFPRLSPKHGMLQTP